MSAFFGRSCHSSQLSEPSASPYVLSHMYMNGIPLQHASQAVPRPGICPQMCQKLIQNHHSCCGTKYTLYIQWLPPPTPPQLPTHCAACLTKNLHPGIQGDKMHHPPLTTLLENTIRKPSAACPANHKAVSKAHSMRTPRPPHTPHTLGPYPHTPYNTTRRPHTTHPNILHNHPEQLLHLLVAALL